MIDIYRTTSLDKLMAWRKEVLANVFGIIPDTELLEANRKYYTVHIPDSTHIAYIASLNGTECGCGAVCFSSELPSPDNPHGRCAYLMNIYVRKEYRNMGIAHRIVTTLVDEALRQACDKIYLETTEYGRPLYESLGFSDMADMMKYCKTHTR